METPASLRLCLAILILRTALFAQDAVASHLKCGKTTIIKVEEWFKTMPFSQAEALCLDFSLIGEAQKLIAEDQEQELLITTAIKVGSISAEAILRHYRSDYLKQRVNVMSVEARDKHWADFAIVADVLLSNLRKIQGAGSNAKIVGNAIDGGSIWLDEEPPPILFSRTDRENQGILEKVDSYYTQLLLQHLKQESSLFDEIADCRELTNPENISKEFVGRLTFVSHGGLLDNTTCEMCKPWYE